MGFVRAKGPDGAEFTIDEGAVKTLSATVIKDADAVDVNGRPLPFEAAPTRGGKAADTKKES